MALLGFPAEQYDKENGDPVPAVPRQMPKM
jgi:hypothetical protein